MEPDERYAADRAQDRAIEAAAGWPTAHELVVQLREALGLFAGAMPVPPQQVWEEALAEARRLAAAQRRVAELEAENDALRSTYETWRQVIELVRHRIARWRAREGGGG
jgi:hypothetical protein